MADKKYICWQYIPETKVWPPPHTYGCLFALTYLQLIIIITIMIICSLSNNNYQWSLANRLQINNNKWRIARETCPPPTNGKGKASLENDHYAIILIAYDRMSPPSDQLQLPSPLINLIDRLSIRQESGFVWKTFFYSLLFYSNASAQLV